MKRTLFYYSDNYQTTALKDNFKIKKELDNLDNLMKLHYYVIKCINLSDSYSNDYAHVISMYNLVSKNFFKVKSIQIYLNNEETIEIICKFSKKKIEKYIIEPINNLSLLTLRHIIINNFESDDHFDEVKSFFKIHYNKSFYSTKKNELIEYIIESNILEEI